MTIEIIRRDFAASTKATDEEKREAQVIASTDAVDAYGEILVQDWDLTRYRGNPVVLFGHRSDLLPIGYARDVDVKDGKLVATIAFVDASANELAEQVWQGIKQGSIRGISVGFRSKSAKMEKIDGRDVYVLRQNELLEISVVPIGANPEAVIESARSMRFIRELAGAPEPAPSAREQSLAMRVQELDDRVREGSATIATLEARVTELTSELATVRAASPAPAETESPRERELAAQLEQRDRAALIAKGRAAKKLTPGMLAWAAKLTLEQLTEYVDVAPAHPVLASQRLLEPSNQNARPTWREKRWDELTPGEKHDLYHENRDLYETMKEMHA